jgi:hypothetical protein
MTSRRPERTFEHSVVEMAHHVAMGAKGSSDPVKTDDLAWLRWRISEGWNRGKETPYDLAVRSLAIEALRLHREEELELSADVASVDNCPHGQPWSEEACVVCFAAADYHPDAIMRDRGQK